jgi:hypothetical protein
MLIKRHRRFEQSINYDDFSHSNRKSGNFIGVLQLMAGLQQSLVSIILKKINGDIILKSSKYEKEFTVFIL